MFAEQLKAGAGKTTHSQGREPLKEFTKAKEKGTTPPKKTIPPQLLPPLLQTGGNQGRERSERFLPK